MTYPLAKWIVLQSILAAGLLVAYQQGLLAAFFTGPSALFCGILAGSAALGLAWCALQRWDDVRWIAGLSIRAGLLGTVTGLIAAFSVIAASTISPEHVASQVSFIVDGMRIALHATFVAVATNIWLHINLRILATIRE